VASFGLIEAVGVESSGSYGAGLTLALLTAGVEGVSDGLCKRGCG
jgi:hypothetical protein